MLIFTNSGFYFEVLYVEDGVDYDEAVGHRHVGQQGHVEEAVQISLSEI